MAKKIDCYYKIKEIHLDGFSHFEFFSLYPDAHFWHLLRLVQEVHSLGQSKQQS